MENLLPVLASLACPVGMGLMMWMMRGDHASAPQGLIGTAATTPTPRASWLMALGSLGKCLNWKVGAGLAAVGLALFLIAPHLLLAALPLLLVLVCPLSMLLMMRGRHEETAPLPASTEPIARSE